MIATNNHSRQQIIAPFKQIYHWQVRTTMYLYGFQLSWCNHESIRSSFVCELFQFGGVIAIYMLLLCGDEQTSMFAGFDINLDAISDSSIQLCPTKNSTGSHAGGWFDYAARGASFGTRTPVSSMHMRNIFFSFVVSLPQQPLSYFIKLFIHGNV